MKNYEILVVAAFFCILLSRFYLSEQPRPDLVTAVGLQEEQKSSLPPEYASRQESFISDRLSEPGSPASSLASVESISRLKEDYATVPRELGFDGQEVYGNTANFYQPGDQVSVDDGLKNNSTELEFERSPQKLREEYEKVLLELEFPPGDAAQTAETSLENVSHVGAIEEDHLQTAAYKKVLNELGF